MSRQNLPRFLIEPAAIRNGRARLRGAELRHMGVRRLQPGRRVVLLDSSGTEYEAVISRIDPRGADLLITAATRPQRESPLHLRLAQAALKGPRLDTVIEKATELGVAEIAVFTSRRSVARPAAARRERWERIAVSAAKQSGRLLLPEIIGPLTFDQLVKSLDGRAPTVLFHPEAKSTFALAAGVTTSLRLIVGPEGGFTSAEVQRAQRAGGAVASLGPRTLRGETAAVAAVALAQFLWGDLGAAPEREK